MKNLSIVPSPPAWVAVEEAKAKRMSPRVLLAKRVVLSLVTAELPANDNAESRLA